MYKISQEKSVMSHGVSQTTTKAADQQQIDMVGTELRRQMPGKIFNPILYIPHNFTFM